MELRVIILRGPSGSGKTTWAKTNHPKAVILSADDEFEKEGVYSFDPRKLDRAHGECLVSFVNYLESYRKGILDPDEGTNYATVIVDNTNCSPVELAPYVALAQAYASTGEEIKLEIIRFECPVSTAIARNIHNVPEHTIRRQASVVDKTMYPRHWPKETIINT